MHRMSIWAETSGNWAWAHRGFETLWRQLDTSGDEIAWHPHLWRWSAAHGCWYQETEDNEWIIECLERGYEALCKAYGGRIFTCRMRWEFHNNVTMQKIDELGIRVDMSAVPGRHREAKSDRGSIKHGELDWRITGQEPYHPSEADYRRPPSGVEAGLTVWEVPRRGIYDVSWGLLNRAWHLLRAARTRRSVLRAALRPDEPHVHAPGLAALPWAFSRLMGNYVGSETTLAMFATAFHSDEVLSARGQPYSRRNLPANVRQLFRLSARSGEDRPFVCARDATMPAVKSRAALSGVDNPVVIS